MTTLLTRLKQIIADYFNPPRKTADEERKELQWTITAIQMSHTTRAGTQL